MIRVDITKGNEGVGKLDPNWQGPFKVAEILGLATYKLEEVSGKCMPRTWNAQNLKKYH